jgi:hydroxyacylglutathione hydrolase
VDTRRAADYARAHVPGTINIPLDKSFTTWAGWLIPYDRDFHVIVDEGCGHCLEEAVRDLAMIGLDRLAGWFGTDAIEAWRASREPGSVPQMTAKELAGRRDKSGATIVDVRGRAEWEAGHIPGVENVPLGYLTDRLAEIPRDMPIVVHCQSGARSAIAASLLRAKGVGGVFNLTGGFAAWQAGGHPVERGAPEGTLAEAT